MSKQSAGLLVYKRQGGELRVLLVHPGGPIWAHRDLWSIPKGELDEDEDHLKAAYREFKEEVGVDAPKGEPIELGSAKAGNKVNYIWALEGDVDVNKFSCNTFTMEWPPKSGKMQEFPECDRAEWFDIGAAKTKVFEAQVFFLDSLVQHLR
jgi:predicted NUDIX family NTP pyrophosphohydrolase